MSYFLIDMVLALISGLNVAVYASDGRSLNLGIGVACGIAALVQRPSKP